MRVFEFPGMHFICGLRKWSIVMEHGNWLFVYTGLLIIVDAESVTIT